MLVETVLLLVHAYVHGSLDRGLFVRAHVRGSLDGCRHADDMATEYGFIDLVAQLSRQFE